MNPRVGDEREHKAVEDEEDGHEMERKESAGARVPFRVSKLAPDQA